MKTFVLRLSLGRLFSLFAILGLALAPQSSAQPVDHPTPPKNSATFAAERSATLAAAFETALAYCAKGDLPAAEAAMAQANLQKPDTIQGELESATRLIHLSIRLRDQADYATSNQVLNRALARLEALKASRIAAAATSQHRARVHETIGFIYERLLPDSAAAEAAYAHAQREAPDSKAAQTGIERLQQQAAQRAQANAGKN